ncbi:MAG: alpha-L-rhamnosidase, partial [Solirubrobacterales bacterium]
MIQLGTFVLTQIIAVSSVGAGLPQVGSDVRIVDLRCEYMVDPLGVDVAQPRLSWKLESRWRGQKQTAYQILVSTSEKMLSEDRADLWDTGKVVSDQSIHVAYSGQTLASRTRCYWKVRIWDADGKASPFSEVNTWDMGLLAPADWKAK